MKPLVGRQGEDLERLHNQSSGLHSLVHYHNQTLENPAHGVTCPHCKGPWRNMQDLEMATFAWVAA